MQTKPVRTYLDPDAVGPLPRAVIADDSDALAAARTMVRLPESPTQEIRPDDLLEVVDPSGRPSSLAPVGFDTASLLLPRRQLGRYLMGAVAVAVVILGVALTRGLSRSDAPVAVAAAAATTPPPTVAPAVSPPPSAPAVESTVGTLRVDGSLEGQRIYLDGVALTATAAMLRCGPHTFAVGSLARQRIVDVPCGGDLTVFR
jgi:hypothetical protein